MGQAVPGQWGPIATPLGPNKIVKTENNFTKCLSHKSFNKASAVAEICRNLFPKEAYLNILVVDNSNKKISDYKDLKLKIEKDISNLKRFPEIIKRLKEAKRPIILLGGGVQGNQIIDLQKNLSKIEQKSFPTLR